MVVCGNCGKETPDGAFCIYCGTSLAPEPNEQEPPIEEVPVNGGLLDAQDFEVDSESEELREEAKEPEKAEPSINASDAGDGESDPTEEVPEADGSIDEGSEEEDADDVIGLEVEEEINSETTTAEEHSLAPVVDEAPVLATTSVIDEKGESEGQDSGDSAKPEAAKKENPYKIALIVLGALALLMVLVAVIAVATAETRTVIDVPAHKEKTGKYQVTMDDDEVCYVGQDWYDCIEDMADEYYGACTNRTLATSANPRDVTIQQAKLVQSSSSLCSQYKNQIDRMRSIARPGSVVETTGGYGHLTATETMITIPEESHEAVCYLGFIGECE